MMCLLCSDATGRRFSHGGFNIFWCAACDFGRLEGEFTPESTAELHRQDSNYYTHSADYDLRPPSWPLLQKALAHLAWRVDRGYEISPSEVPGHSACDIGCGNGNNLRRLRTGGFRRTVGIEPDENARVAAHDAGEIVAGTAEDMPIKGETFDAVTMFHVLEHCIDPIKAVANARSLMTEASTLVIEVPNNAALGFRWFEGNWPWSDIPRHLSFFTETSLRTLLSKVDLEVTRTIYLGYNRQFFPKWRARTPGFKSGWPLLAATAFAPASSKYDSVRVHAKIKPKQPSKHPTPLHPEPH